MLSWGPPEICEALTKTSNFPGRGARVLFLSPLLLSRRLTLEIRFLYLKASIDQSQL